MGLGEIQQGLIRAVFTENIAAVNICVAVVGVILGTDLPKVQISPDAFTERSSFLIHIDIILYQYWTALMKMV